MNRQLNDWIETFMRYTCRNTEVPEVYRLWCAISTISAVLQRKCRIEWGTLTFYPNMYIVLVGPSGIRKGTAMAPALDLLEDMNVKLAAEAITREALIRELKNANVTDTSNLESGQIPLHSSLTIFSPELTVFLGFNNEQLMSDLTDWYDCRNKWTYRTKNMGTDEIRGVYVNLIGATTPDLIRDTMSLKAIGGGLTSRMIFVYADEEGEACPAPFLSEAEIGLQKQLRIDLESISMLSGRFQFTEGFLEKWTNWYYYQHENKPFKNKQFAGYMRRRPNHVMKLCMILSASRWDKMILEEKDLDKAVRILESTEVRMQETFAGVGKYTHADTLTQVMNEIGMRGKEGISREELTYLFRNDANREIMKEIIETLNQMEWLDVISKEGKESYVRKTKEGDAQ